MDDLVKLVEIRRNCVGSRLLLESRCIYATSGGGFELEPCGQIGRFVFSISGRWQPTLFLTLAQEILRDRGHCACQRRAMETQPARCVALRQARAYTLAWLKLQCVPKVGVVIGEPGIPTVTSQCCQSGPNNSG